MTLFIFDEMFSVKTNLLLLITLHFLYDKDVLLVEGKPKSMPPDLRTKKFQ